MTLENEGISVHGHDSVPSLNTSDDAASVKKNSNSLEAAATSSPPPEEGQGKDLGDDVAGPVSGVAATSGAPSQRASDGGDSVASDGQGLPLSVMPGDDDFDEAIRTDSQEVVGRSAEGAAKSAEERAAQAEERAENAEERVKQLTARVDELMRIMQEARSQKKAAQEVEQKLEMAEKRADFAGKRCEQLVTRLHEASEELAREQQRGKEEVKEWEVKYEALEAKLGRLHAKAKEKVQGLNKENEELQQKLVKEGEKHAQLLSSHVAVAQERDELKAQLKAESARVQQGSATEARLLDEIARARAQAAEVLRAAGNNSAALHRDLELAKEREEGLRKLLEAKGAEMRELRDAALSEAREQLKEDQLRAVQEREKEHVKDISELQQRLQQKVAAYESQVDEVTSERDSAAALNQTLQAKMAEKETLLATREEELVKTRELLAAAKKDLAQLQEEWDGEREAWKGTIRDCEVEARNASARAKEETEKRELMEREHHVQAVAASEARGIMEAEWEGHRQALSHTQSELAAAREKHARALADLAGYKVRAHALLQKRDSELAAMKDVKAAAEQEEAREMALREAKRDCEKYLAARDAARKELEQALKENEMQAATHAVALAEAVQQHQEIQARYQAARVQLDASQVECRTQVEAAIATWKAKCEALELVAKRREEEQRKNLLGRGGNSFSSVIQNSTQLKAEIERLRDAAARDRAEMEKRIGELEDELTQLREAAKKRPETPRQSSLARLALARADAAGTENGNRTAELGDILQDVESEDQILVLARLQALREDELDQCKRQISTLQQELADMERECTLRTQQEAMLKEEFRNMERTKNREGVDMMYLKNVILKLLETREVDALMPVIAMLLQFSPDEVKRAKEAYKSHHGDGARKSAGAKLDSSKSVLSSFKK